MQHATKLHNSLEADISVLECGSALAAPCFESREIPLNKADALKHSAATQKRTFGHVAVAGYVATAPTGCRALSYPSRVCC